MEFDLGDTLECHITGLVGKVSQVAQHIYSQDRYCVQPPYNSERALMPSAHFIDGASLKLNAKSELATIHRYKKGEVELGDIVLDTLTEMTGKVTERSLCLNGCYRLKITYKGVGPENSNHAYHTWVEEKGVKVITPISKTETMPENRVTGSVMEEVTHG